MTAHHTERPIFLWGMAGVGKSTVGHHLSQITGRPFVDLDLEIVALSGKTISEIFAASGEVGFRRLEKEALSAVLQRDDAPIIALGGGTLLDTDVHQKVRAKGQVVYLSATVETLAKRLRSSHIRPLLSGDDLETSLRDIFASRSSAYQNTDLRLETDERTVQELAQDLAKLLERERAA